MHFIVSSSQLLRHLSSLSGVLNSSNTLPILDNFLFELGPGEAVISASDLETTMTTNRLKCAWPKNAQGEPENLNGILDLGPG